MRGLAKGEPNLKILVLSDSHRCVGAMYDAAMLEKPDVIFHLGDHVSDAQELSYALDPIDFYEVRGNCDFGAQAPETILTELAKSIISPLMQTGEAQALIEKINERA